MFGHIIEAQSQSVSFREVPKSRHIGGPLGSGFQSLRVKASMHLFRETFLLFSLNLLDAILTIIWVRNGVASEGNQLMARLLDSGDFTFLIAKIAIGTITAIVLLRWGNRRMARYGLTVALAVYISLMGIHVMTGLTAFGYISQTALHDLTSLTNGLLAILM
jgi:hypothetical protein